MSLISLTCCSKPELFVKNGCLDGAFSPMVLPKSVDLDASTLFLLQIILNWSLNIAYGYCVSGKIGWMNNVSFHRVFFHWDVNNENELFIRRANFLKDRNRDFADGLGQSMVVVTQGNP
jgi:hypothetical protein